MYSGAAMSGGQQQKLVIFCLAGALRYQLAAIDDDALLYRAAALAEQPATERDEAAGEDEIEQRQRDQRGDDKDEEDELDVHNHNIRKL